MEFNMLKLTLMTVGLLATNLAMLGLDAMAATAPTFVVNGSVRGFYAQGVFDFKNGDRPIGQGIFGSANEKKPGDNQHSGFNGIDIVQFQKEAARRAEEERQFYYLYPDRLPKTPNDKK
jgi:hypothetical protein